MSCEAGGGLATSVIVAFRRRRYAPIAGSINDNPRRCTWAQGHPRMRSPATGVSAVSAHVHAPAASTAESTSGANARLS